MNKTVISEQFKSKAEEIQHIIQNFDNYTEILGTPERNIIKKIAFGKDFIVVKSFKIPNFINKIVYGKFRKSKARRSFEYGSKLLSLGINNPLPVSYTEYYKNGLFDKSYYFSLFYDYDFTYREIEQQPDYKEIAKAFIRFNFEMQNKGVFFKDNTPGNTLISRTQTQGYEFYIVDLNRMEFKELSFEDRINSFHNITQNKEIIEIMVDEYVKISGYDKEKIYQTIKYFKEKTLKKNIRKQKLKKLFKK